MQPVYLDILLDRDFLLEDTPKFPLKDEFRVNYNNEFDPNGNLVRIRVNILTAKVLDWKKEYGYVECFTKAVDTGTYILYDEDMKELDRIEQGYVPNKLIPEHDGYGDYIDMRISTSGYVLNWYNNPSLEDFHVDFDAIKRVFED